MTPTDRLLLRAELHSASEIVVAYAFDLTAGSVFVVTDWRAPLETRLALRLSFPRVLAPIDLAARVAEVRAAGAPGERAGLRLDFDEGADASRGRLAAWIATLAPPAPSPARGVYRVLLVEDSGLTRDVLAYGATRFFGDASAIEVHQADSAERAWERLAAEPYDLLLVDYALPEANGAALIAQVRLDPRLRALPVVAISVGGAAAREATMAAGADLFVDKPFAARDLFKTLRTLAHATPLRAPTRTILVFDDSPLALAMTRAALEGAGFGVAIAEDLAAFERMRARAAPDLILVDIQMPEAFGDDVVAMLVANRRVDVPVVLFSSLEETELAQRSAEAGATGYISKGAGMDELVRRCRELLEPRV